MHRPAVLPRRLRRRSAALLLAASLGALSGCGGSDDGSGSAASSDGSTSSSAASSSAAEDSGSSSSAPADEQGGTLTVTGVDFAFEMDSTELSAGDYEVEFANEGGASHDVRIEQDGEDVAQSEVIPPGESTSFTATLEPGTYVFYCSVGNHRSMGMEVEVTVT